MTHSIYNSELENEIIIDETLSSNVSITIIDHEDGKNQQTFYLTPKELHNLIGTLLHVQAKKRQNV